MTQVAVCCGAGGTGKTTVAAALAMGHARGGSRVAVLTIDPARRLADALGVEVLDNTPRAVPLEGTGTLHALMLDRRSTWDEVVARRAEPQTAERLFANRYYQAVATRLSGSQEYMAVEKLHDLVSSGDYDVVVVDTPPTQHAVDFFRAPERMRGILDRSVLRALVEPSGALRGAAARGVLGVVSRIAGDRVMEDIRDFFGLIGEMSDGFRARSEAVAALLVSPDTRYFLLADASAPQRSDLETFLAELQQRGMGFAGFLVNRVAPPIDAELPTAQALRAAAPDTAEWGAAVDGLCALARAARAQARAHQSALVHLRKLAPDAPIWMLPELPEGVASTDGLLRLAAHLPSGGGSVEH